MASVVSPLAQRASPISTQASRTVLSGMPMATAVRNDSSAPSRSPAASATRPASTWQPDSPMRAARVMPGVAARLTTDS